MPNDVPSKSRINEVGWLSKSAAKAGLWIRRSGIGGQLLSLVIVTGSFAIGTSGRYLSAANLQVILRLASIPAIIATGLHQVVVLGGIDLSVEGVVALCVVFVGFLARNRFNTNDVGLWIVPITVGFGGLAGIINGLLNTKLRIPSFIITLGMSWVLWGFAVFVSKGQTIPLLKNPLSGIVNGNLLGIPDLALIAFGLIIVIQIIQDRTRFGRYLYAIGGDEVLAAQAGVKVEKIKIAVFGIAGLFYGLSALFLAIQLESAQAITGNNLLFPAVTAVAVGGVALTGGIGGAKNAALGALIVTALNDGLILLNVNPYAQEAVNGFVLVTAVALTIDRRKLGFIK
ncbi:MAG: ABC transporter permease [Verrucomicrobia bacterium]|nr:ABC transporter permease [Verrucomicrobiota bacterium]